MRIRINSMVFTSTEIEAILDRAVEIHTGMANGRRRKLTAGCAIGTDSEADTDDDDSDHEGKIIWFCEFLGNIL